MVSRDYHGVAGVLVILAVIGATAAWLFFTTSKELVSKASDRLAQRKPTDYPQLVSVEPLPPMEDGSMCEWVPAGTPTRLVAAIQEERFASAGARTSSVDVRPVVKLERRPLRVIRDPYPTYTAVALDVKHNEIVLQDENLFQIMAFDRVANTPPAASMTEPKRLIGGFNTKMEFNCGLYVDPKTGDIYSVNNDTLNNVVVFSREARGNVPPTRELATPHRTYGITVDEVAEEMFLTVQDPPFVVVYNKYAKGNEKPIRILRGNKAQMADPHGIGLDTKNGWMFVANYGNASSYDESAAGGPVQGRADGAVSIPGKVPGSGKFLPPSITVYSIKASGDTAPIRVIQGPDTQLNWPAQIYVDEEHGELYVANDGHDAILVFRVTDSGNAAPIRILKGPKTQIKNPTGVAVDNFNDELVVANMGNHRATVYSRTAQGDTPPVRTIRAGPEGMPALMIGNPGSIAYDTKREQILVPN